MKLIYSSFQHNHQNYETNHAAIQNIISVMTGMQKEGGCVQSYAINTDSERGIESVCINGVSVLSVLNSEKKLWAFFPQQIVHNNEAYLASVRKAETVPSNPK